MAKRNTKSKPTTNFALPPPVPFDPPSALSRYRWLLIAFIVLFLVAIGVARHEIRIGKERPLPPEPVYLQHYIDKDADRPSKTP